MVRDMVRVMVMVRVRVRVRVRVTTFFFVPFFFLLKISFRLGLG